MLLVYSESDVVSSMCSSISWGREKSENSGVGNVCLGLRIGVPGQQYKRRWVLYLDNERA